MTESINDDGGKLAAVILALDCGGSSAGRWSACQGAGSMTACSQERLEAGVCLKVVIPVIRRNSWSIARGEGRRLVVSGKRTYSGGLRRINC